MLIDKLKEMKIKAMKENDVVSKKILSVLHSDALGLAKKENRDVYDEDIVKASKFLIKKNEQTISLIEKNKNIVPVNFKLELDILNEFLPVQMSEEEIKKAVDDVCAPIAEEDMIKSNMGTIMSYLKKYGNKMNMSIASKYVSSLLK